MQRTQLPPYNVHYAHTNAHCCECMQVGPDVGSSSAVVLAMVSLASPVYYSCDFRPLFTTFDPDYSDILQKHTALSRTTSSSSSSSNSSSGSSASTGSTVMDSLFSALSAAATAATSAPGKTREKQLSTILYATKVAETLFIVLAALLRTAQRHNSSHDALCLAECK
jgi:hypothetical protein